MDSNLKQEYDEISKRLFTVEVETHGVSGIMTNFSQITKFNWDNLNLQLIKRYPHIYRNLIDEVKKDINNQLILNKQCPIDALLVEIQLYLPGTYQSIRSEIIHRWLSIYRVRLNGIYQEDKFDLSWYDVNSSDRKWTLDRINNLELITREIENYYALFRDIVVS